MFCQERTRPAQADLPRGHQTIIPCAHCSPFPRSLQGLPVGENQREAGGPGVHRTPTRQPPGAKSRAPCSGDPAGNGNMSTEPTLGPICYIPPTALPRASQGAGEEALRHIPGANRAGRMNIQGEEANGLVKKFFIVRNSI